jgi:hypothetical protein
MDSSPIEIPRSSATPEMSTTEAGIGFSPSVGKKSVPPERI